MNHIRPAHFSVSRINAFSFNVGDNVPDDRNWEQLELVNTPFDRMPKSIDVRNISSKRGQYNIQNIGIFLWRIKSFTVTKRQPYKVDNRKYKFDALGKDIKLYNWPDSELSISTLAERKNISMPLSRREAHELSLIHI